MTNTYIRRVKLFTPPGVVPWSVTRPDEYNSLYDMANNTGYLIKIVIIQETDELSIITLYYTDKAGMDYIDELLEDTPERADRTAYEDSNEIIREIIYVGPDDGLYT
jgi:hypothetical protein